MQQNHIQFWQTLAIQNHTSGSQPKSIKNPGVEEPINYNSGIREKNEAAAEDDFSAAKIEKLKADLKTKKQERKTAKNQLKDFKDKAAQIEKKESALNSEIQKFSSLEEPNEENFKNPDGTVDEDKFNQSKQEYESKKAELEKKQAELEQLKSEKSELNGDIQNLENKLTGLNEEISSIDTELDNLDAAAPQQSPLKNLKAEDERLSGMKNELQHMEMDETGFPSMSLMFNDNPDDAAAKYEKEQQLIDGSRRLHEQNIEHSAEFISKLNPYQAGAVFNAMENALDNAQNKLDAVQDGRTRDTAVLQSHSGLTAEIEETRSTLDESLMNPEKFAENYKNITGRFLNEDEIPVLTGEKPASSNQTKMDAGTSISERTERFENEAFAGDVALTAADIAANVYMPGIKAAAEAGIKAYEEYSQTGSISETASNLVKDGIQNGAGFIAEKFLPGGGIAGIIAENTAGMAYDYASGGSGNDDAASILKDTASEAALSFINERIGGNDLTEELMTSAYDLFANAPDNSSGNKAEPSADNREQLIAAFKTQPDNSKLADASDKTKMINKKL